MSSSSSLPIVVGINDMSVTPRPHAQQAFLEGLGLDTDDLPPGIQNASSEVAKTVSLTDPLSTPDHVGARNAVINNQSTTSDANSSNTTRLPAPFDPRPPQAFLWGLGLDHNDFPPGIFLVSQEKGATEDIFLSSAAQTEIVTEDIFSRTVDIPACLAECKIMLEKNQLFDFFIHLDELYWVTENSSFEILNFLRSDPIVNWVTAKKSYALSTLWRQYYIQTLSEQFPLPHHMYRDFPRVYDINTSAKDMHEEYAKYAENRKWQLAFIKEHGITGYNSIKKLLKDFRKRNDSYVVFEHAVLSKMQDLIPDYSVDHFLTAHHLQFDENKYKLAFEQALEKNDLIEIKINLEALCRIGALDAVKWAFLQLKLPARSMGNLYYHAASWLFSYQQAVFNASADVRNIMFTAMIDEYLDTALNYNPLLKTSIRLLRLEKTNYTYIRETEEKILAKLLFHGLPEMLETDENALKFSYSTYLRGITSLEAYLTRVVRMLNENIGVLVEQKLVDVLSFRQWKKIQGLLTYEIEQQLAFQCNLDHDMHMLSNIKRKIDSFRRQFPGANRIREQIKYLDSLVDNAQKQEKSIASRTPSSHNVAAAPARTSTAAVIAALPANTAPAPPAASIADNDEVQNRAHALWGETGKAPPFSKEMLDLAIREFKQKQLVHSTRSPG